MENKKTIRSNRAQIRYLCHYMAQNPSFAAGEFRTPLGAKNNNDQWLVLKQALDELGPNRSVDQWKICWRDQKKKAREEGGALNKAKNTTGNFVVLPNLSENSLLVLSAIGKEMAVGCGPEESPIGCGPEESPVGCGPEESPVGCGPEESPVGCGPEESPVDLSQVPTVATTSRQQVQAPKRKAPRRARQALPHDRFLNAQLELNNLMKELITEVRRSNDLSEKRLNFMCGGANKENEAKK